MGDTTPKSALTNSANSSIDVCVYVCSPAALHYTLHIRSERLGRLIPLTHSPNCVGLKLSKQIISRQRQLTISALKHTHTHRWGTRSLTTKTTITPPLLLLLLLILRLLRPPRSSHRTALTMSCAAGDRASKRPPHQILTHPLVQIPCNTPH